MWSLMLGSEFSKGVIREIFTGYSEVIFLIVINKGPFRLIVSIIVAGGCIRVEPSVLIIQNNIWVSIYALDPDTEAIAAVILAWCPCRVSVARL